MLLRRYQPFPQPPDTSFCNLYTILIIVPSYAISLALIRKNIPRPGCPTSLFLVAQNGPAGGAGRNNSMAWRPACYPPAPDPAQGATIPQCPGRRCTIPARTYGSCGRGTKPALERHVAAPASTNSSTNSRSCRLGAPPGCPRPPYSSSGTMSPMPYSSWTFRRSASLSLISFLSCFSSLR